MTNSSHPQSPGSTIVADLSLRHGLTPSTEILTAEGPRPVRELRAGDRIITRDLGLVSARTVVRRERTQPVDMVEIPAHAFGHNRPERPIQVLWDQPIMLRDWRAQAIWGRKQARVAAGRLVDGTMVRRVRACPKAIYSLHFSKPAVIYAQGLELVSAGVKPVILNRPKGS